MESSYLNFEKYEQQSSTERASRFYKLLVSLRAIVLLRAIHRNSRLLRMSEEKLLGMAVANAGLAINSVIGKAQEILRMLRIRVPIGQLKKAEICRHLFAIEIACQLLNLPVEKSKLVSQAPVSFKIYQEALINCKRQLEVKNEYDVMQMLAVKFGTTLKSAALNVLDRYEKLYIEKLDKNRRRLVSINLPECQAAAFYIVATKNKVKLSKSEVAAIAEVDATYFSNVVDEMSQVVKTEIVDDMVESRENQNVILKSRKRSLVSALVPQTASSSKFTSNILHSTTMNINGQEFTNSHYEESVPSSGGVNKISSVGVLRMVQKEIETNIPEINKITNRELLFPQSRKDAEAKSQEEDDKSNEGKENKIDIVRGNYDRWKEIIEKKRKLS